MSSEIGFHNIEDDLSDTWVEDWANAGVAEVEAYLKKHAEALAVMQAEHPEITSTIETNPSKKSATARSLGKQALHKESNPNFQHRR